MPASPLAPTGHPPQLHPASRALAGTLAVCTTVVCAGMAALSASERATNTTDKAMLIGLAITLVTCKVRVPTSGEAETIFVSVIAFDAQPCRALLELGDGDSVALSGALTPKVWTDKQGQTRPALDMVAHQVLTAYHVTRKRKAMEGAVMTTAPQRQDHHSPASPPDSLGF